MPALWKGFCACAEEPMTSLRRSKNAILGGMIGCMSPGSVVTALDLVDRFFFCPLYPITRSDECVFAAARAVYHRTKVLLSRRRFRQRFGLIELCYLHNLTARAFVTSAQKLSH